MAQAEEFRRETRLSFDHAPPLGDFSIVVAERELEVVAVHDVSHSGIRVQIASPLGVATPVRVRYRARHLNLQQDGVTRWEAPATDGATVVGIELKLPALPYGAE